MRSRALAAGALLLAAAATPATAQDTGQRLVDEVQKRVVEIHRLMQEAEEHLAESTLDPKARAEAGQAARRAAEKMEESKDAAESAATTDSPDRERMREARTESVRTAQGIRDLIDHMLGDGKQASEHMQWLIDNAFQ